MSILKRARAAHAIAEELVRKARKSSLSFMKWRDSIKPEHRSESIDYWEAVADAARDMRYFSLELTKLAESRLSELNKSKKA